MSKSLLIMKAQRALELHHRKPTPETLEAARIAYSGLFTQYEGNILDAAAEAYRRDDRLAKVVFLAEVYPAVKGLPEEQAEEQAEEPKTKKATKAKK